MARMKFIPIPPEILLRRAPLKIPAKPGDKTDKTIEFSPIHFKIFCALFYIFNPLLEGERSRVVDYKTINEYTNIPVPTIKKHFPIMAHNFPRFFRPVGRDLGKGLRYEWFYSFDMASAGKVAASKTDQEQIDEYLRQVDEVTFYKWQVFARIKIEYENKRLWLFQQYARCDINFWERNVAWAEKELKRHNWKDGIVPIRWIYRCLEQDYGYNKLNKEIRNKTLIKLPGVAEIEARLGESLDKMFTGFNKQQPN